MAGAIERQTLKSAAIQALGESRVVLGGELSRVRTEWSPRLLLRHSVEKHKIALLVAATIIGLGATRFFLMPRKERAAGSSIRGKLAGLAATTLWSLFQEPVLNFARTHFASYIGDHHQSPEQDKSK